MKPGSPSSQAIGVLTEAFQKHRQLAADQEQGRALPPVIDEAAALAVIKALEDIGYCVASVWDIRPSLSLDGIAAPMTF